MCTIYINCTTVSSICSWSTSLNWYGSIEVTAINYSVYTTGIYCSTVSIKRIGYFKVGFGNVVIVSGYIYCPTISIVSKTIGKVCKSYIVFISFNVNRPTICCIGIFEDIIWNYTVISCSIDRSTVSSSMWH